MTPTDIKQRLKDIADKWLERAERYAVESDMIIDQAGMLGYSSHVPPAAARSEVWLEAVKELEGLYDAIP